MKNYLTFVIQLFDRTVMGRIDVRVPDEQEELIDNLVEGEYGSRSEFVREAIRNEIRERIDLKQLREAENRMEEIEDGEVETISHDEVKKLAGLK